MLSSGVIKPSRSSYSSSVLLVQNDGSWRFCVDYRTLNFITIKDRYPIPVIEELFDELVEPFDVHKTARTKEEHLGHLRTVLGLLRQHELKAKDSKCLWGQQRVDHLGHIISKNGVEADPKKIQSMGDWPLPKTTKELRGFLGLIDYYHRFVANYDKVVAPLTALLRKGAFL
ncbi:uncharacterized mitochondrial protein AtMg00860-like [Typha angustifolia]|uniref:uncharacterized mitochondrial protein AtMg00860-like n=1 Tax=Typha angustifolia TaxID=59011 RepID=UPI003C2CF5BE